MRVIARLFIARLLLTLACLGGCKNACGGPDGVPERLPDPSAATEGQQQAPATDPKPPAVGVAATAADLAAVLPEQIGEFRAMAPAAPRTLSLSNGGKMTSARRKYRSGDAVVRVELTDAQHAPSVRLLFQNAQRAAAEDKSEQFKSTHVAGRQAIKHWEEVTRTSSVDLLVAGRFLVNLRVSPTGHADSAGTLAAKLPYERLIELGKRAAARSTKSGEDAGTPMSDKKTH